MMQLGAVSITASAAATRGFSISCRRRPSCVSTTSPRRCSRRSPTEIARQPSSPTLSRRAGASDVIRSSIDELLGMRAIHTVAAPPPKPVAEKPKRRIPLQTLVLNVTSKCNLSCGYCYEYGEDRIVEAATQAALHERGDRQAERRLHVRAKPAIRRRVNLTFFGGETLLNFKMLKSALAYARERAEPLGKQVNASLTTNATLLREEIIDWIVDERRRRHRVDRRRARAAGQVPRLLERHGELRPHRPATSRSCSRRHRRRPVGARVTLTGQNLDVASIYRHLYEELGFWEVGFAPVTTSWQREYAIEDAGLPAAARRIPEPRRASFSTRRSPDAATGSRTCATRSRRFTRG